jgi:GxxExxY protein
LSDCIFPFDKGIYIGVDYKGEEVGQHRLDFFVFSEIVVELKAVKQVEKAHFAVVRSYLRASGREHGLILNFSDTTLAPKRVKSRSWP